MLSNLIERAIMIVYSKKIIQFIQELKQTVKHVISREVGLKVFGDRFYDRFQKTSYPLKIVVYNNKAQLGYFDPNFYELGFHECLMYTSKEQLNHVIRHEIAHYITFMNYGEGIQHHGPEYRSLCKELGWGEEIYQATFDLEIGHNPLIAEESGILRKVQKLMALASSSNTHEAEQALIKSQQILLKNNIESKYIGAEEDEKIYLKRIMKQKKENAKMRAIATILQTFYVNTVYSRTEEYIYLEILGNAVNIEIAEYVAYVLDVELEKLWKEAQKQANLKGMVAKNSFFLGIAKGYCDKIQALKRDYNSDVIHAVMIIEKKLVDQKALVYQRLSYSKSGGNSCRESSELGELMGKFLNINPALSKAQKSCTFLELFTS